MPTTRVLFLMLTFPLILLQQMSDAESSSITTSRTSCVQILTDTMQGTGFFIGTQHIVTCLHVVASCTLDANNTTGRFICVPYKHAKVTTINGETIGAELDSIPANAQRTNDSFIVPMLGKQLYTLSSTGTVVRVPYVFIPPDLYPFLYDFAVLRLAEPPKTAPTILRLSHDTQLPDVGTQLLFSGYPLDAPTMLTHFAVVSGTFTDHLTISLGPPLNTGNSGLIRQIPRPLICLQAPVNKGNSGGALISTNGQVIGLINAREGRISMRMANLSEAISRSQGDLIFGTPGVKINLNKVVGELIDTLDKYISPGIGYAVSAEFLGAYLETNPDLLK